MDSSNHSHSSTSHGGELIPKPTTTRGRSSSNDHDNIAKKWKKYDHYVLDVDHHQDDKAKDLYFGVTARPHMRAFYYSAWAFFFAFLAWFSITPLLSYIRADLGLTKRQIWNSSIAGVSSSILFRILAGPLCDVYGPRILFVVVLVAASIPVACTGLIQTEGDLIVLRFFIGMIGSTFVMAEYWTTRMFVKDICGSANALVAGWGNLGAVMSNLFMGRLVLPVLTTWFDDDTEKAWRTACIIPAFFCVVMAFCVYQFTDDCPKGNYHDLKRNGSMDLESPKECLIPVLKNRNAWILFLHYACCFGVELSMYNAAALYFEDVFGLSTTTAVSTASTFGWMNLFARGMGGIYSDCCNYQWGMKGRLWIHFVCLFAEGALVLVFINTNSLAASIGVLIFFSIFVQAAEGTTFAIVPYVDSKHMGAMAGLVGAGGNFGAAVFGVVFRQRGYQQSFVFMGITVIISSLLTVFIQMEGRGRLLGKDEDQPINLETGKLLAQTERSESALAPIPV